jgi:hypothetical protein
MRLALPRHKKPLLPVTPKGKAAMYLSAARAVLAQRKSYRTDKALARDYIAMAAALRRGGAA